MEKKRPIIEQEDKGKRLFHKTRLRKTAGIILIVAGVLAIISAIAVPVINRKNNDRDIEDIRSGMYADDSQIVTDAACTGEGVQPATEQSVTPQVVEPSVREQRLAAIQADNSRVGIIEIEKIDVLYAIVEGTEDEQINRAIGHLTESAGIGEQGNCVLAGHRGGYYGTFFERLPELEDDDTIILTDLNGKQYEYVVYDQKLVDPADWSVIRNLGDLHTLTLITCEDDTRKRYVVFATLVR